MANENELKILLSLEDIASKGTKKAFDEMRQHSKAFEQQVKKNTGNVGISFKTMVGSIIGASTAIMLFNKSITIVKDTFSAAIQASTEFEVNVKKLSVAVENAGFAWSEWDSKLLDFADSMQKITVYGNTQTLKLLQELIPYTNDVSKAMEGSKIAMDMASAGLFDLSTASKYVGMAMQGNVEMLGRYIGELRASANPQLKLMSASEKTAYALDLLKQKFGGMAEKELDTFQGAVKKAGNSWSDFLRAIGDFIVKNPATVDSIKRITAAIDNMTESMNKIGEKGVWVSMVDWLSQIENYFKLLEVAAPGLATAIKPLLSLFDEMRQSDEPEGISVEEEAYNRKLEAERQLQEAIKIEKETALQSAMEMKDTEVEYMISKEYEKLEAQKALWQAYREEELGTALVQQQQQGEMYSFLLDTQQKANESYWGTAGKLRDQFSKGISTMFGDMLRGTFDAEKAFKDLGIAMVQTIIDFMVQKTINMALSKAFQALEVGLAATAGAAIAAAYAPAAAMVSLSTFGANAAPAQAGIASTVAMAHALAIPALAEGGVVDKPTMALIGEAGPEIVAPLDKIGYAGGNIINISIDNPIIRDDNDIDALIEQISDALNKEAERI